MRVLGLDLYYDSLLSTRDIIEISERENRVILTKNRKLLESKAVSHAILIRPDTTTEQIRQIIDDLDIKDNIKPFSRCLHCNTLLNIAIKGNILDKIPPKIKASCDEWVQCRSCNKIYRKGVHFIHMKKVVRQILDPPES